MILEPIDVHKGHSILAEPLFADDRSGFLKFSDSVRDCLTTAVDVHVFHELLLTLIGPAKG